MEARKKINNIIVKLEFYHPEKIYLKREEGDMKPLGIAYTGMISPLLQP